MGFSTEAVVPERDFAAAGFDAKTPVAPRMLLIIYSTPRSGSTMLCDIVRRAGLCVPHEYFQPFEYRPALEARWNVTAGDDAAYVQALFDKRTGPSGMLGINLHGHHLEAWSAAQPYIPFTIEKTLHVYLRRREDVAQAVSYSIATQTRKWSSAFEAAAAPVYGYDDIAAKRRQLAKMNRAIVHHLQNVSEPVLTVNYEDVRKNPRPFLDYIGVEALPEAPAQIQPQGGGINQEFIVRFQKDHSIWKRLRRALSRERVSCL